MTITQKHTFILLFFLLHMGLYAQKEITITIDDPNTTVTPKLEWQERNNALLKTLKKHHVKAALFVCGMRVADSNGRDLLKQWDDQGHMICNHSYSHLYFNSKSNSFKKFRADFNKGDSIIKPYRNYAKYFRFPYLKEGNTVEKRDSMRVFMSQTNYKNGAVTIDASDWYIDAEIAKALKENPDADLSPYKNYYIQHILDRATYYDSLAVQLFNRPVKHTLLLHHSLLNALFLDDLLSALKKKGWKLIDAQTAFKDPVFEKTPNIVPCGESIIWQCAKTSATLSQSLRYPGEDSEYEKIPLEEAVKAYKNSRN